MSKKYLVAIDDGHGMETAGKRTPPIPELDGRVIRENEFNSAVKKLLDVELKRCGFDTLIVAPGDTDAPLKQRVNLANSKNADIYVSIHYNAFDGKFDDYDPEGHSVHIHPGSKEGRKLAECILKYLTQGTKQRNRGVVEQNLYVLRKTKMPAVLSENGFMDNKREALLMLNVDFQKEVAQEHAQGICEYFGVNYMPMAQKEANSEKLYRVRKSWKDVKSQIGAFAVLQNAKDFADEYSGYTVYDSNGKAVYKGKVNTVSKDTHIVKKGDTLWGIAQLHDMEIGALKTLNSLKNDVIHPGDKLKVKADGDGAFLVRVTAGALNIRNGPGTNYKINGTIRDKGVYTITETQNNWGKLKSGVGWISLKYTKKIS